MFLLFEREMFAWHAPSICMLASHGTFSMFIRRLHALRVSRSNRAMPKVSRKHMPGFYGIHVAPSSEIDVERGKCRVRIC